MLLCACSSTTVADVADIVDIIIAAVSIIALSLNPLLRGGGGVIDSADSDIDCPRADVANTTAVTDMVVVVVVVVVSRLLGVSTGLTAVISLSIRLGQWDIFAPKNPKNEIDCEHFYCKIRKRDGKIIARQNNTSSIRFKIR
jgi:hypothetical protein